MNGSHKYKGNSKDVKPPDLWIHHERLELKPIDKSPDPNPIMTDTPIPRNSQDITPVDNSVDSNIHQRRNSYRGELSTSTLTMMFKMNYCIWCSHFVVILFSYAYLFCSYFPSSDLVLCLDYKTLWKGWITCFSEKIECPRVKSWISRGKYWLGIRRSSNKCFIKHTIRFWCCNQLLRHGWVFTRWVVILLIQHILPMCVTVLPLTAHSCTARALSLHYGWESFSSAQ